MEKRVLSYLLLEFPQKFLPEKFKGNPRIGFIDTGSDSGGFFCPPEQDSSKKKRPFGKIEVYKRLQLTYGRKLFTGRAFQSAM
jgi:hypothetical protein